MNRLLEEKIVKALDNAIIVVEHNLKQMITQSEEIKKEFRRQLQKIEF